MPGEPKVDDENSLSPAKFDIPKPEIGEVLTLETGSYTVEQLLSGATSDAYIITRDDGEKFALRLPNLRNVNLDEIELDKPIFVDQTLTLAQVYQQIYSQGSTLSVAQKRELVNKALKSVPPLTGYYNILGCMLEDLVLIQLNEAQNAVNESVIIKRTEGGLWGTCPYSIQEYAPPEYENKQVGSIKDEQRVLIVMLQVAEAMGIAHSQGMALKDFKPPFKGDRIRCDPKGLVKIIDWNITGDNTDIPRDLIYMGGYLHSFLLGVQADVNDLPTHYEIGKGIPNWDVISQAAKNILQRTLSRDPSYRYSSTKQLIDDLAFSIALIDKGHAAQKDNEKGSAGNINGLINDASYSSVQGEYNRVLAIVDIFEKCQIELNEGQKGLLGNLKDVATKELKKKDLTLIAYAKATIFTGNFEKAKSEFLKIVSIIGDPEIKAQAQLLIFLCDYSIALAQAKGCDQYSIPQVRNTTEWQTAQEASDALLSGDLKKAKKLVDNLDHALSADPSLLGVTKNFEVIQDCVKSLSLQTEAKQMWSELQQTETNHGEKFRTLSTILNKFQEGTASAHGIELLDNSAACKNVESALAQAWQELEADYQGIKVKTQQKDTLDKTALSAELGTWIADLRKVSAALSEGDYQLSIEGMLAELEYQRKLLDFGEERTRLLTIIAEQKAQIEQLTPATTPEAGPAQPTGLENPLLDELTRQLNLATEQLNANAANPAPVLA